MKFIIEIPDDAPSAQHLGQVALYGVTQVVTDLCAIEPKAATLICFYTEGATEGHGDDTGLLIMPDGEIQHITNDANIHEIIGGYFEAVPNGLGLTVFANEDGLRLNLPSNRTASLLCERNIVGPVIILGPPNDQGDTTSLTDQQRDLIESYR